MPLLIQGDARRIPLKDESVDIIFTSPPYNVKLPYEDYDDNLPEDEFRDLMRNFLSEAYRVCAESSRMYCVLGDKIIWWFKPMAEAIGFHYVQKLTWCKPNLAGGSGKISGDWNYMSEDILLFRKGKRRPMLNSSDSGTFNWFIETIPQTNFRTGKIHIAQFPYRLCKRILARTPGAVVLDPFCGSGQVLRAARVLGRQGIGIEIGKKTIRKAHNFVMNHRIKQDDTQSGFAELFTITERSSNE
jgi:site-specific DNA-methyltransferase (adenine-specific)